MFMVLRVSSWQNHYESSPGSFDECRTAPSGRRPSDQAKQLGLRVRLYAARVYTHHRHLLLLLSPEADTHFTAQRLSRPSWLVTYQDNLTARRRSPISVLTGSDVAQLR